MKERFTVLKHPLVSGLLIGAVGGTVGTLIYSELKNTRLWSRFDAVFDFGLGLLNRSFQTPLYVVVIFLLVGSLVLFLLVRRTLRP